MQSYSKDDADEFVERVDEVTKQIQDLLDDKIDIHELDRKEKEFIEKDRLKIVSAEIRMKEHEDSLKKGRSGKGHKGGYLTFCRGCHREYTITGVIKCAICGKDTITEEERMDELKTKM